jgi:hypothetical protein
MATGDGESMATGDGESMATGDGESMVTIERADDLSSPRSAPIDEVLPWQCPCLRAFDSCRDRGIRWTRRRSVLVDFMSQEHGVPCKGPKGFERMGLYP